MTLSERCINIIQSICSNVIYLDWTFASGSNTYSHLDMLTLKQKRESETIQTCPKDEIEEKQPDQDDEKVETPRKPEYNPGKSKQRRTNKIDVIWLGINNRFGFNIKLVPTPSGESHEHLVQPMVDAIHHNFRLSDDKKRKQGMRFDGVQKNKNLNKVALDMFREKHEDTDCIFWDHSNRHKYNFNEWGLDNQLIDFFCVKLFWQQTHLCFPDYISDYKTYHKLILKVSNVLMAFAAYMVQRNNCHITKSQGPRRTLILRI